MFLWLAIPGIVTIATEISILKSGHLLVVALAIHSKQCM